jgi:hypothetical protein
LDKMPTPIADSNALGARPERPLAIGECLGVIVLILLPGVGFLGLVALSVTRFSRHLWGVARAALLWHVLLWSALTASAAYFAFRVGAFVWEILKHLGPVR